MTNQKRLFSNKTSRLFKMSSLTGRISSSYTGQKIKELFLNSDRKADSRVQTHIRNAERIVKTLGELKGAAMKIGQHISIQTDILPKEFAEILSSLQQSAPPVDYELVASYITAEFGKSPEALFGFFDPEPYASASIGQVHRAKLPNGTEVVVKVQYPEIEENIEGDLLNLKTIISTGNLIGFKKADLNEIFEEIRDRLNEELNYDQEMENLVTFRDHFKNDKRVLVPRVFPPYCSNKVLTMEYLPGDTIGDLFQPPYTQDDRNHFGYLIFDLYMYQVLKSGLLHADPHPGNFAFKKDGRLILYDFGCIKQIPKDIQQACRDLCIHSLHEDYERIDETLIKLGSRDPQKEPPGMEFYRQFLEIVREPFFSEEPHEFGSIPFHEKMMALAPLGMSKILHFKPCRETIFIGRIISGHYGNLCRLRAKADWQKLIMSYLND